MPWCQCLFSGAHSRNWIAYTKTLSKWTGKYCRVKINLYKCKYIPDADPAIVNSLRTVIRGINTFWILRIYVFHHSVSNGKMSGYLLYFIFMLLSLLLLFGGFYHVICNDQLILSHYKIYNFHTLHDKFLASICTIRIHATQTVTRPSL